MNTRKEIYPDDNPSKPLDKDVKSALVVNLFCFSNGVDVQERLSWVANHLERRGIKTLYCNLPPTVELGAAALRETVPNYDVVLVDNPLLHKGWEPRIGGIQPTAKRFAGEFNELYFVLYDGAHDVWSGLAANELSKIGVDYDVIKESEGFSVTEGYGKVVQTVLNKLAQQTA